MIEDGDVMAKKLYYVEVFGWAEIEIDDAVINQVDEEWRQKFYGLETKKQVIQHVAHNVLLNKLRLSQLDGFANLADDMVRIDGDSIEIEVVLPESELE